MSFLTDEWRAAIRAKANSPDLAAARAALAAQNAAYHATLPDLPDRQAGYYHDFFCPGTPSS